jgi:hypothetical protein
MRSVLCLIGLAFFSGVLSAQSPAPAKQGQTPPSKDDPQGYSKEIFEEPKMKTDLGTHKIYTAAPVGKQSDVNIPADLPSIVTAQFGTDCTVALKRSASTNNYRIQSVDAWSPFLTADLDSDGIEDAIIVARCGNPLARRDEFGYQVIDPYMTFHGYGDPRVTAEFSTGDPDHGHVVLIIHGAGADSWRAAKPKSKFVVLNLPFNNIGVTTVMLSKKKPLVKAVLLQEGEITSSVLFWDGKKYRWRDSAGHQ